MTRMTASRRRGRDPAARGRHQRVRAPRRGDQPVLRRDAPRRQSITHTLARHVEGASHMAEGYTRARAGNIGVCVGTSGPAGTDMITGLYSASADSIPILCITGQAPVARLHKEDFQAVDIAVDRQAAHQDGDDGARAGPGAGRLPAGVPPDALGPARARPDRPALRRAAGRDRIRRRHLPAAAGLQAGGHRGPRSRRRSTCSPPPSRPAHRRRRRHHQRRRERPAGRVRRAGRRAGHPDPDGLGRDPRRPSADGRHGRPADRAPLRQRDDARSPTSCWASATAGPTGTPAGSTSTARGARSCTSTSSRPRSAGCSPPTSASCPTPRPRSSCSSRSPASRHRTPIAATWVDAVPRAQGDHACAAPTSTTCRSSRSASTRR